MLAPLIKGIEVEVFTGDRAGAPKDLSPAIIDAGLDGFVFESDARHVEYVTDPIRDHDELARAVMAPRLAVRKFLEAHDATIFPGSTLALPFDQNFHPSRPNNAYYQWVGQTFGTKILTSSVHISVGVSDPDSLVRIANWLRMDAPLLLALTAASPYRNGEFTGYHSSRWVGFPQEPLNLPFFNDHADFIQFVEGALANGTMRSVRHMWTAVRPNGPERPYDLNRIETRICDLVYDPALLLAITAVLEARIIQLGLKMGVPDASFLPVILENERRVAKDSLDARIFHYGKEVPVRVAIARLIGEVEGVMRALGTDHLLAAIEDVLSRGNEA